MDVSRSLISKLVEEGRLNEVNRAGITPDFLDEDSGPVLQYINRHFAEYRKVASRDAVRQAFPGYVLNNPKEPLEYYIKQAKKNRNRGVIGSRLEEVAGVYEEDPDVAEQILRDCLSELHAAQKSFQDVNVAEVALDRFEEYLERKENPGADGILSNWPKLDYQTLGWHPEEFVVLVAPKYTGKTWWMIWEAYQAALQGERVLFVTKEMSQKEVVRRLDSIIASISFDSLRRGELTHVEEERYKEKMVELAEANFNFMVARQGVTTIEDIQIKAVETDATIVFGDSIYLFNPDSRSRYQGEVNRRMAVSQMCKRIAAELGIPFIVSVQAGRSKKAKGAIPDLDDIEWSNAFSQDANTVIYLEKTPMDKEVGRAHLYLLKCRDGQETDFFIDQNFEQMIFHQREDDTSPSTDVFEDDDEIEEEEETFDYATG